MNEITVCILFQEVGSSQKRAAKWGSGPAVRGSQPLTFTSERHELICLATVGSSESCV